MIRIRLFDKVKKVEFCKYFVNEWYATKFCRKLKYSQKLQVIGVPEYVNYNDLQPKK